MEIVAEMWASGCTRQEVGDAHGVDPATVTRWLKRDDVRAAVTKHVRDRANRVLRKVDAVIASTLENAEDLPLETLLKIRKEYSGERVEITASRTGADITAQLWGAADEDPELAQKMLEAEVVDAD